MEPHSFSAEPRKLANQPDAVLSDVSFSLGRRHVIPTDPGVLAKRISDHDPELFSCARQLQTIVSSLPAHPGCIEAPRAFIVGGYVRDALLQTDGSKDLDIEVYGTTLEQLRLGLENHYGNRAVNLSGERFKVLKLRIDPDTEIDISIPRLEFNSGPGYRGFDVVEDPTLDIEQAGRRRDFTMNSLLFDLNRGKLLDPFGGLEDLQLGRLSAVDVHTFKDDPLRVLRAVGFCSRFDLKLSTATRGVLEEMVASSELEHLSYKKIGDEMDKLLLRSERPSIGLVLLRDLGVLDRQWPELSALSSVPQDPKWHPEGDVLTHTMMVVDAAARLISPEVSSRFDPTTRREVMWAALLHDVGKLPTTEFINGRWCARGHEAVGGGISRSVMDRLQFSRNTRDAVAGCVERHLIPSVLFAQYESGQLHEPGYRSAIRKVSRDIGSDKVEVLLALAEADHRGRSTDSARDPVYRPGLMFRSLFESMNQTDISRQPLVTGRDLLEMGFKPGPLFGKIQREIGQLEDQGILKTKQAALDYVKLLDWTE